MPIDVFGSLKSISDKVFAGFLGKIIENPIWISVIISLVIVLLVVFLYPAKPGTKFTAIIKLWIYVFIGSFGVLLLHDSSIKYHLRREYIGTELDEIAESIMHPVQVPANSTADVAASTQGGAEKTQNTAPPVAAPTATVGLPYIPATTQGGNPFA